ncbi:MAG: hypothetical protein IJM85_02690 [Clostridia bacterium]|nr:hypothetical protein [Clostridia bacterium]
MAENGGKNRRFGSTLWRHAARSIGFADELAAFALSACSDALKRLLSRT